MKRRIFRFFRRNWLFIVRLVAYTFMLYGVAVGSKWAIVAALGFMFFWAELESRYWKRSVLDWARSEKNIMMLGIEISQLRQKVFGEEPQ